MLVQRVMEEHWPVSADGGNPDPTTTPGIWG